MTSVQTQLYKFDDQLFEDLTPKSVPLTGRDLYSHPVEIDQLRDFDLLPGERAVNLARITLDTIDFFCFNKDFLALGRYVERPNRFKHEEFVANVVRMKDFMKCAGQRTAVDKFLVTLNEIMAYHYGKLPNQQIKMTLLATLESRMSKVNNVVRSNSVVAQHYGLQKLANSGSCNFIKLGTTKVCLEHRNSSIPPPYSPSDNFSVEENGKRRRTSGEDGFPIYGLLRRDAAFGNFADYDEYENFVALIANGRIENAEAMAAGLAGGAHVFSMRDPFPFSYCKLLLFDPEKWSEIFQRGQDKLTKIDLEKYAAFIKKEKVISFIIDVANQRAHISMERNPGPNGVRVKVGTLVDELKRAFDDGVCDFEELQDIYYHIRPAETN